MLKLEARPEPSQRMALVSPVLALALTALLAALLFVLLGKDPVRGLAVFFIEPLNGTRAVTEVLLKATPLIVIALGLAVCYRANVWNIGAEGQFLLGAIGGGGMALWLTTQDIMLPKMISLPLVMVAGVLGGMLWAALVALLRDGFNFPQTKTFDASTWMPLLVERSRLHIGFAIALVLCVVVGVFLFRTFKGFQMQVGGLAPAAARYAGFSSRSALWTALLLSGGLAGLAGAMEAAGPLRQLTPHISTGLGFTAIIVCFVGRLHPLGIALASVLLSMMLIGGELAQSRLGLPNALTGVFQGLLLLLLLVCDTLIHHRVRWAARPAPLSTTPSGA